MAHRVVSRHSVNSVAIGGEANIPELTGRVGLT
jgi:hypothetical protein